MSMYESQYTEMRFVDGVYSGFKEEEQVIEKEEVVQEVEEIVKEVKRVEIEVSEEEIKSYLCASLTMQF